MSSHLEFDLEPLSIRMSLYDILQLFSLSNEFTQVVATSKRSTRTEKTGNCPARNGAFHIRCPSFRLLLMSSTHTPFVCLSLYDLSPVLMLRQSDAALDTKINASCDFFNHRINCWEPMVEAFQVVLGLNSQHNDNGSNSLFIFSIVQGNQDSSDRKVLELVLSEDFILALLSWMSNMTPNLSISGKYHEFEVINSTGVPLMFWIESKSSSPTILKLRPDELVPLYNIFSSDSKGLETSQFISLQIEGGPWDPILSILISKVDNFIFPLQPRIRGIETFVAVEITLMDGKKHVVIRSTISVTNFSSVPLEIQMSPAKDQESLMSSCFSSGSLHIGTVKPEATAFIPVPISHFNFLEIRPQGHGTYGFCHPEISLFHISHPLTQFFRCSMEEKIESTSVSGKATCLLFSVRCSVTARGKLKNLFIQHPLCLRNELDFNCCFEVKYRDERIVFADILAPGEQRDLPFCDLENDPSIRMHLDGFESSKWYRINDVSKFKNLDLLLQDNQGFNNILKLSNSIIDHKLVLRIASPFWIHNDTGIDLVFGRLVDKLRVANLPGQFVGDFDECWEQEVRTLSDWRPAENHWTDCAGRRIESLLGNRLGKRWSYTEEGWTVWTSPKDEFDLDGWRYCSDFESRYINTPTPSTTMRRRRWVRRKICTDPPEVSKHIFFGNENGDKSQVCVRLAFSDWDFSNVLNLDQLKLTK